MANVYEALAERIKSSTSRILAFFCKAGAYYPPDDKSGVVVNGETETVLMDMGGNFYYLDDDGNKVYLPKEGNDFVNINEKHMEQSRRCFDTGAGKVQMLCMISVNDQLQVLKQNNYVERSTDTAVTVGDQLTAIPDTWTATDCIDGEDDTTKYLVNVDGCFGDGTNKIYVKGYKIVDKDNTTYSVHYTIVDSNTEDHEVGEELDEMPTGYEAVECNCCK